MTKVGNKIFLLLFTCITAFTTTAQIVNIERARMQSDTTGWMGNAGIAVSLAKNIQKIFTAETDAHIQYKTAKSLYLFLGSYSFLKGGNTRLIDNMFFHIRYNYKLTGLLRWEIFTQLQKNQITNISYRFLFGTGPRFKILSNKTIRLYAGSLLMYEEEKEKTIPVILHTDIRSSSYISFTFTPNKQLEIISTSFFQPLLNDFSDYRFLNQASLRVKAGKKLGMRVNWNYLNDSKPVVGIPSVNYTFSTGLDYDF